MNTTRRRARLARLSALLFSMVLIGCARPRPPVASPPSRPSPVATEAMNSHVEPAAFEPAAFEPAAFERAVSAGGGDPLLAIETTPPLPSCNVLPSAEPAGLHRGDEPTHGRVVLTFDDGPYPDHTGSVLDTLARQHMTATFFVLGRHITSRSYHLLQRMEAEGHVIGSHSYDHDILMARHGGDAASVAYIRGQHEVTRVLIELALLAQSPGDFDTLTTEVLGLSPDRRLPTAVLESGWPKILERHRLALAARGYPEGRYPVLYSRPPGGGPYLGRSKAPRARYDEALRQLGMLNVMWHGLSGDVDPSQPRDYAFLTGKIEAAARRGGVLLIHDFIRADALDRALGDLAGGDGIEVVAIDEALADKYGCEGQALASQLAQPLGGQARSATLGAL